MCWMWLKFNNNNGRRWNINPITKLIFDGIITTTGLINIQADGAEAIGIVVITHEIWIQYQIMKLLN